MARPQASGRGYGVERYTEELCASLATARVQVTSLGDWRVANWLAKRLPPYGPKISVAVYEVVLPLLFVALRGGRADIIHFVDVAFTSSSLILAKMMRRGAVVTIQSLHRVSYIMPKTLREPAADKIYAVYRILGMKLSLKYASVIIAPSSLEEEAIRAFFGDVNVVTVNSSNNISSELPHKSPDGRLTLGSVGALVYWKRVENAIRVLAKLADECEGCRLLICGEGPSLLKLRELASGLGLGSRVEFVGHLSAGLERFYSNLDFLIFASLRESFGYPIIEAASCGVPSITFSDSVLAAEVRRLTITTSGIDDAAQVIIDLWKDRRRYLEAAEAAKAKAAEFSRVRAGSHFARIYLQVLYGWRRSVMGKHPGGNGKARS